MRATSRRLARSAMLMSDIRTVRSRPSLSSPRVVRSFFSTSLRHSLAPQSFAKNVRCQGIHGVFSNTSLGHLIGREVQPVYRSLPANPPSSPPKQLSTNFLKVSALQRLHGIQILPQISQHCSLSTSASSAKRPISNQAEQSTLSMRIIKQTLRNLKDVPVPALALGLAGLIPFVGLATPFADLLPLPIALYNVHAEAQAAYGAVIITFVGAVHWGLAMADYGVPGKGVTSVTVAAFRYIWSVIPSLLAWPALLLDPVPQFSVLISSLLLALIVDTAFAKNETSSIMVSFIAGATYGNICAEHDFIPIDCCGSRSVRRGHRCKQNQRKLSVKPNDTKCRKYSSLVIAYTGTFICDALGAQPYFGKHLCMNMIKYFHLQLL